MGIIIHALDARAFPAVHHQAISHRCFIGLASLPPHLHGRPTHWVRSSLDAIAGDGQRMSAAAFNHVFEDTKFGLDVLTCDSRAQDFFVSIRECPNSIGLSAGRLND